MNITCAVQVHTSTQVPALTGPPKQGSAWSPKGTPHEGRNTGAPGNDAHKHIHTPGTDTSTMPGMMVMISSTPPLVLAWLNRELPVCRLWGQSGGGGVRNNLHATNQHATNHHATNHHAPSHHANSPQLTTRQPPCNHPPSGVNTAASSPSGDEQGREHDDEHNVHPSVRVGVDGALHSP